MEKHVKDVDRLLFLMEEICILKSRVQEHDTGHIITAINVLNERIKEVKENINEYGRSN